ncbi:MAG: DMT family transporter [Betaproteobacteria bacterium]|nr:DMT family transporter [Betaproteobacteria bacterium]
MSVRRNGPALAVLAAISLVWGFNWVVLKIGVRHADPFEFLAWRFALAAACLFGAATLLRRPVRLVHAPQVLLIGLLQTTATFALATWALKIGAVGKTAVLNYTMPFWVTLLAWPVLGERPSPAQGVALGVGLLGLLLLIQPHGVPGAPEFLALASGIAWGLGVVVTKRLQSRTGIDTLSLIAWQVLLGGAALTVLAVMFPGPPAVWSAELVLAIVYNGVLVSALGWFLWFWALARLDAGLASFGILAVPVLGALFSAALLGERPGGLELVGMALIVVALALAARAAIQRTT